MPLVLSLFPGVGLLDQAFEEEGFCVVRGPDVLWGGDIRRFHPPAGVFDGVIGGPPCQAFSRMQNINRARGRKPAFGNLIPEFERCVMEAASTWFVMENVPDAPLPSPAGYATWSTLLNNRQCFDENGSPAIQNRVRRWTFGDRRTGRRTVLMIDTAPLHNPVFEGAAIGHATSWSRVNSRPEGSMSRKHFEILKRKQGLSADFDLPPFTVQGKCKAIGNGVPMPMGRAIAKAVKEAVYAEEET